MNNKALVGVVGGLVIGFALLSMYVFSHPPTPGPQGADGKPVGALAGPDIPFPYLRWGSVAEFNMGMNIAATSSTLCSFQNTSGATSTVVGFGMVITSNTFVGAFNVSVATSSSAFATSSPAFVIDAAVGAAATKYLTWEPGIASTTLASARLIAPDSFTRTGESPYVLAPNEYLNFKVASGTPGTYVTYLSGACGVSTINWPTAL